MTKKILSYITDFQFCQFLDVGPSDDLHHCQPSAAGCLYLYVNPRLRVATFAPGRPVPIGHHATTTAASRDTTQKKLGDGITECNFSD